MSKQKTVIFDSAKLKSARTGLKATIDKFSGIADKIKTGQEGNGGQATPEQVSEALEEVAATVMEAVEEIKQINEALPNTEGSDVADELSVGARHNNNNNDEDDDDDNILGGRDEGDDDDDDDDKNKSDIEFEQLAKKSSKFAKFFNEHTTLVKENLQMKKANLAKEWAGAFPAHLRKAQEESFIKENEEEEDLEKMEAKVQSAKVLVSAYNTEGLINRSRMPQFTFPHTAKNTDGQMKTAKQGEGGVPFYLRM